MIAYGVSGCTVVLFILVSIYRPSLALNDTITNEEREKIQTGLEFGKGIADLMAEQKFSETLAEIGTSISPYLGAIGPFFRLLLAYKPASQSIEEEYLKTILNKMKLMMESIDNQFYNMEQRVNDIERIAEWSTVKVQFGHLEQKILAMAKQFQYLYQVPQNALKNRKTLFSRTYESDYQDSGNKLYHAVILKQGKFYEDLGSSILRYTENNCRFTKSFLIGVMQLLLEAGKIELAYLRIKNFNYNADYERQEWERKIKTIIKNFVETGQRCRDNYHYQSGVDTKKYALATNKLRSNRRFAEDLYKILSEKYFWRNWIVFVYNKSVLSKHYHYAKWCDGHIFLANRRRDRNIHIASNEMLNSVEERNKQKRDFKKAYDALSYYNYMLHKLGCNWSAKRQRKYKWPWQSRELNSYSGVYRGYNLRYRAMDLFYTMPYVCNVAALRGRKKTDYAYSHSENLMFNFVKAPQLYHGFLWG